MRRPSRLALAAAGACLALAAGCGSNVDGGDANVAAGGAGNPGGAGEAAQVADRDNDNNDNDFDVIMRDVDGKEVGVVNFERTDSGAVEIEGGIRGLDAQGYRGFHIHQNPVCEADAPDGPFTTAGGHYNPGDKSHGEHAGDLPSLLFDDRGNAEVRALTTRFTLDQLRQNGAALIIHAQPDNFAHIPDRYKADDAPSPGPDEQTRATGDAGNRIACGVIPKR